jgi:hypothetical protein
MTEREELVERLAELGISVVLPDGEIIDEWVLGSLNASAVLAEIERTHVLVPRVDERLRRSVGDAAQYLVNPKIRRSPF